MSTQNLHIRSASAGSGKTYTLAAHYIALLLHGESYRSILAVTFTNKATAEMKERILTYLYGIARETNLPSTQGFLRRVREISNELGFHSPSLANDDWCRRRAEELFTRILADYDSLHVSTIDAFLQSLLSGMIQMLGGAVGYTVELDTESIINDAVDRLLTERAQDPDVQKHITTYMDLKLANENRWDIRSGLKHIATQLYNEQLQQHADQLVLDANRLEQFRQQVDWQTQPVVAQLKAVLPLVKDCDAKKRIIRSLAEEKFAKDEDIFRGFTDKQLEKLAPDSPEMQMHLLAEQCKTVYWYDKLTTAHLNDLVLMNELHELIEQSLRESNSRLLNVTAATLMRALKEGDADFILEKVGIRYRHIMLDEFQDTSSLQWDNFRLLIEEILASQEGSTLIVGDLKQSIYRWRNGDWTIMQNLSTTFQPYCNNRIEALTRNFRSEREVVRFNLETLQKLAEKLDMTDFYEEGYNETNLRNYYRAGHEHGYVQVRCSLTKSTGEERHEARRAHVRDMFDAITRLHAAGVGYRDMLILIRNNDDAALILDTMHGLELDLPFVSSSCFQLGSSPSVQVIIAAMRCLYRDDQVCREYLRMVRPDIDTEQAISLSCMQYSLSDFAEYVLRTYLCNAEGRFIGNDTAYLMAFRDSLRHYVAVSGSDGKRFLTYWEDKLYKQNIPATDTDGIRIMTIHASKGLEAKNVFIPFCNWKLEEDKPTSRLWCEVSQLTTEQGLKALLPVPQKKLMIGTSFEKKYKEEHRLQKYDNLNLLYVAFTRAAERLYVYADAGQNRESVASLLHSLYGEEHTVGSELWEKPAEQKQPTATQPFRFTDVAECQAGVYSSEEHIEFQQSQDSRKYGWDIATWQSDLTPMDARVFGTICHEVMARLSTYPDREKALAAARHAVEDAFRHGLIPDKSLCPQMEQLACDVVSHPVAGEWFVGDWRVLCEETVIYLNEHGELEERRMDRVMWRGTEAIVLDYKFGHDDPSYDRQVQHYMNICRQMGATTVRGYLWMAAEKKCVEV